MTPDATPDQAAAHVFLAELRTRIATQQLPYQYGVEQAALESLWKLFDFAREAVKEHPGCHHFSDRVAELLNHRIRPLTSKWHRAMEDGRLKSRDGADEFRGDLNQVRTELLAFAQELHRMARGEDGPVEPHDEVMPEEAIRALFENFPYAIADLGRGDFDNGSQLNHLEKQAVDERRKQWDITTPPDMDAVGLALSGGGIRSATFGLGVVQVLADKGLLKDIDFLSTVSGGGYTGSFITRRLGGTRATGDAGVNPGEIAAPSGPDTEPVRYLRQNAKFLAARNLKESWTMVIATLAGLLLNWTVPLLLIVLSVLATKAWIAATVALHPSWNSSNTRIAWQVALGIPGLLTLAALVSYCFRLRQGKTKIRRAEGILGGLAAITVLVAAGWLLHLAYHHFARWATMPTGVKSTWVAVSSMIVAAAPAIVRFMPVLKNPTLRKIVLKLLLLAAGLILPVLMVATGFLLGELEPATLLGMAAVLAVIGWWALDINLTAPHRLYRNGLAKTFVQTRDGDQDLPLEEINASKRAPYHLINAAVNLPASEHSALRDRRCDFFLFSKEWTGSTATGYARSAGWQHGSVPIDLATAMAISGAAFSSYMGLGSMPSLTALLTFLNIRLGFWIKAPDRKSRLGAHPGFICLLREMTGIGMSERQPWLNLSDGGHIENMAVYELLRRRCKFILCVDGEADPSFTFQGLMTLVRHARIDFGIRIEPDLDLVRPDPASGLSKCHHHFCRIHYPALGDQPAGTGLLLYLKLSVTGNESELIKRYRINHPEFPHQTTLDQFFDQEQFEAYRQLGVHAAAGLFRPAITSGNTSPDSVGAWFRSLARNLLTP